MTEPTPVEALYLRSRRNGVTLKKLCERAGRHPATLRRWMQGATSPRLDDLKQMNSALDALILEKS